MSNYPDNFDAHAYDRYFRDAPVERDSCDEGVCEHCDGEGRVWNNADPTSGQWVECDRCGVTAQLAAIDAELANSIAYYDQCIELNMCGEPWAEMQKRGARRSAESQRAWVMRELAA